ncbi:hypothetical protein [Flavobacterium sp.]|uniref:hypothetical protein n=1 Tax=Flavobacterium sp. TaxID=239 RepID=UPI003D0ADE91
MEKSSLYSDSILSKLAQSYPGSCTLEELASLIAPPYNVLRSFTENISAQRENHAKILDALILLDDKGYIVLDPASDKSCITLKGLLKINHTVFFN